MPSFLIGRLCPRASSSPCSTTLAWPHLGQSPDPLVEPSQGAGAFLGVLGKLGDRLLQQLAPAPNSGFARADRQTGYLRDLRGAQLFPIMQLEHHLVVERDVSQRSQKQTLLLSPPQGRRWAGGELGDRDCAGVERLLGPLSPSQVMAQNVVGNTEQEGAHTRVTAKATGRLEAPEERPLHEILCSLGNLAQKEPDDAGVVAREQGGTGVLVARTPSLQQVRVVGARSKAHAGPMIGRPR